MFSVINQTLLCKVFVIPLITILSKIFTTLLFKKDVIIWVNT